MADQQTGEGQYHPVNHNATLKKQQEEELELQKKESERVPVKESAINRATRAKIHFA